MVGGDLLQNALARTGVILRERGGFLAEGLHYSSEFVREVAWQLVDEELDWRPLTAIIHQAAAWDT